MRHSRRYSQCHLFHTKRRRYGYHNSTTTHIPFAGRRIGILSRRHPHTTSRHLRLSHLHESRFFPMAALHITRHLTWKSISIHIHWRHTRHYQWDYRQYLNRRCPTLPYNRLLYSRRRPYTPSFGNIMGWSFSRSCTYCYPIPCCGRHRQPWVPQGYECFDRATLFPAFPLFYQP